MAGSLDRRVGALSAMEEWNVRRSYEDCFRRVEREPMLRAILKARIGIKATQESGFGWGRLWRVCTRDTYVTRCVGLIVGFVVVFVFGARFRGVYRSYRVLIIKL